MSSLVITVPFLPFGELTVESLSPDSEYFACFCLVAVTITYGLKNYLLLGIIECKRKFKSDRRSLPALASLTDWGRSSSSIVFPLAMTTLASIAFLSSLMLPGQG